jgi:hypothetical protein
MEVHVDEAGNDVLSRRVDDVRIFGPVDRAVRHHRGNAPIASNDGRPLARRLSRAIDERRAGDDQVAFLRLVRRCRRRQQNDGDQSDRASRRRTHVYFFAALASA